MKPVITTMHLQAKVLAPSPPAGPLRDAAAAPGAPRRARRRPPHRLPHTLDLQVAQIRSYLYILNHECNWSPGIRLLDRFGLGPCTCTRVCVGVCIHIDVDTHINICICIWLFVRACICICTCVCICICICMCLCICMCIIVCIVMYMYMCIMIEPQYKSYVCLECGPTKTYYPNIKPGAHMKVGARFARLGSSLMLLTRGTELLEVFMFSSAPTGKHPGMCEASHAAICCNGNLYRIL